MRPTTLVDAFWPAPAPAPMSRWQSARPGSAERVEEAVRLLDLRLDADLLGRHLRDLLPLCRCLPGVSRVRPLPGGLCGVGDCGLIDGTEGPGLLRVRAWRPNGRLWLSVDRSGTRLQVDLRWRAVGEGSQLRVELHRIGGGPSLSRQLDTVTAQLALWLDTATD